MATGKKTTTTVPVQKTITVDEKINTFQLTLSEEEAAALAQFVIAGCSWMHSGALGDRLGDIYSALRAAAGPDAYPENLADKKYANFYPSPDNRSRWESN